MKSASTCSGVLPRRRRSCVSVTSLIGMRFRMSRRSGRMSWLYARAAFITKMFSPSRTFAAGKLFGILIGIFFHSPPRYPTW